jgi:antitoxin (DNA-binding transcriptional repressor) of toxin-antitoxin stability system
MRTVSISDLEANLSSHLQSVKTGDELLVCDREIPVARIIPCALEDYSEKERGIVTHSVITPPLRERVPLSEWPELIGSVSDGVMDQIWREEREDR